jgi:hypothetical protein
VPDDELPPNVTPISRPGGESRGTRSRNKYATPAGECTHPTKPDDWFCHRPLHQGRPGYCHRPAGWGTGHVGDGPCKLHGGRLASNERAGAERLARRRAERDLEALNTDAPRVENPLEALASLAGEAVRWKDVLAAHVAELTSLRYAVRSTVECPECEVTFTPEHPVGSGEQIRGEVVLYERSLVALGRLLVAIARLNIDDRLARIDERLTDIVVTAVDQGLMAAGVRPEDMDRVRATVGDALRRLSA